ncbi:hypothetical protein [Bradyrhizobium tropiciagri]|uniref:hypothetical protein n=1 Tax=Bradyrhizobium tropiciagri TaxID=312253 RepID=UPI002012D1BA|nr:hypothetical protein [Bradyrhizobium tropiciagri]
MTFDPTINAGNLILVGLAILGFIGGWYKFGALDMLEYRVKAIEETLKIIASAIEKQNATEKLVALVDQRVVAVEGLIEVANKEIADLRRGNGFIQAPRRGNIDGEYSR